jgi:hemophore
LTCSYDRRIGQVGGADGKMSVAVSASWTICRRSKRLRVNWTSASRKELSMKTTTMALRRSLFAVFAASAVGGAAVAALAAPSAIAAPDPCAAGQVAKTVGSVATSTGNYLDSHPATNQALTTISQQPAGPQSLAYLKTYFDANPQVSKDMQTLQQPLVSLSGQCKLPITIPQVLALMQSAQSQGGLPGGLPGSLSGAQTVSAPGAVVAGQPSATSAVTPANGPLPGPATTATR